MSENGRHWTGHSHSAVIKDVLHSLEHGTQHTGDGFEDVLLHRSPWDLNAVYEDDGIVLYLGSMCAAANVPLISDMGFDAVVAAHLLLIQSGPPGQVVLCGCSTHLKGASIVFCHL